MLVIYSHSNDTIGMLSYLTRMIYQNLLAIVNRLFHIKRLITDENPTFIRYGVEESANEYRLYVIIILKPH